MQWRLGFLSVFLFCAGALAYALYEQHVNWVMPCLMCVYERLALFGIGLLALLAALYLPRGKGGVLLLAAPVGLMALLGAGLGVRHLQMQYGPADPSVSCAAKVPFPINLDDPAVPRWLADVLRPVGDCSQLDFMLWGVSMPAWVLISCVGLLLWTLWLGRSRWRAISSRRMWR